MRRIDLGSIDDATARQLLTTYKRMVGRAASAFPWVERDELLSVGNLAVLEGHVTFDPTAGKTEASWIWQTIQWRMLRVVQIHSRPLEQLVGSPERANGVDPEQQFWRATAVRAIGTLSIRHRAIVDGRMRGETFEEIAASLGLSAARAHAEGKKAFALLRSILGGDGGT